MRIFIDADACPDIDKIELLAQKYNIPVILCSDYNHNLTSNYSTIVTLSQDNNNADLYIANHVKSNDIVVTGDYGVAVLTLSKNAFAINPKGIIYGANLDEMLLYRHLNRKLRSYIKTKGPKKRNKNDTDNLINNLTKIIASINQK